MKEAEISQTEEEVLAVESDNVVQPVVWSW
jgi:hypothetical protein